MLRKPAALVAVMVLALAGCSSKVPPTSGSGALKLKDPVWATYGWSKNRIAYIIYFVPSTSSGFNPESVAATLKASKDGDVFEGGLDGYIEKSKFPIKSEPKKGEVTIEGRVYRNGNVFLVNVGTPSKVQQIQGTAFLAAPKDPEEWPSFAESEVKRIAKENPKIGEFPKEPAPDKPDKTKKK